MPSRERLEASDMRMTFLSRGGPRAEELLAWLYEVFPVYEAEPGVFDVYGDDHTAVLDVLDTVRPNWRMYLQLEEGAERAGPWRGWPGTGVHVVGRDEERS
jgi:hypothetical protein